MTQNVSFRGVRLGMTRTQVKAVLGEPTDWDTGSRKQRRPMIYKFGDDVEYHFGPSEEDGLWLVYKEDSDGKPITILR